MNPLRKRALSLLLALALCLTMVPSAMALGSQTGSETQQVLINQVYGGSDDGSASHSFIELYNPTDSAVDLSGWSVQYKSSTDGKHSDQWYKLDLTGTIGSKDYYLIRCGKTSGTKYPVPEGNQEWDIQLHNKGLSVALVSNQTQLTDAVSGDVTATDASTGKTIAETYGIVDLAAVQGNNEKSNQVPPAYEKEYSDFQSKKKAIRRTNFADTDNNKSDFTDVNYDKSVSDTNGPHVGTYTPAEDTAFSADSLTLQPGATTVEVNLNWYAPEGTTSAKVKFGETTMDATVSALHTPTKVDTSKYTDTGKLVCTATVTGLTAGTKYTYQVSNDGGSTWSKAYSYTTPASDKTTFAFTSDPQIKENKSYDSRGWNSSDTTNQTGWAKMMEVIGKSGATLVVSAGDQVEDQSWGKSSEYASFFAPEEMTSLACAPAVGNHDRHYMFADHFNLPNEMKVAKDGTEATDADTLTQVKTTFLGQNSGTSSSHGNYITKNDVLEDYPERREMETEGNYYYLYNNILFVTLNTGAYPGGNDAESGMDSGKSDNSEAEAIVSNFKKTIQAAKSEYAEQYDWLIVTHHKSTETVAKHAADSDIENYVDAGFEQLMADEDVDIVLGGHDHVYSRSYVLDGSGQPVYSVTNTYENGNTVQNGIPLDTINDPEGVLYITGNCASDMQYYTPFEKLDKKNNTDYPTLANGETGSEAYLKGQNASDSSAYLPIGNQEYNQEYSPCYVLFTVEGGTLKATAYNLSGDSENPDSEPVDAFTVTKEVPTETKTQGFANGSASLTMEQIARYDSGVTNKDGGTTEIVAYNTETGFAYAVNGQLGVLTAIPMTDIDTSGSAVALLNGNDIDVKSLVTDSTFTYGDMTSVAVSPDGKTLAAAIQAEDYTANGRVALFTCNKDGTLTFQKAFETGVQPDMVTFTPDGSKVLTANEGEPREGYGSGATDPAGSVTVLDVAKETAATVGFTAYDSTEARAALVSAGVVLKKNTNPSVDLEPEYIACDNTTAYVALQEANAIAVLDLNTSAYTGIYSVGYEDYSKVAVDIDKSDKTYQAAAYENLKGIRMPDGISLVTIGGTNYLLTANEGDSRDWNGYSNETDQKNYKGISSKVRFFDKTDYDGLDVGTDYLFGGRSFTMFKVTKNGLEEVYDSGSDFEFLTAQYLLNYFNCSNDDLSVEDRSGKKGPEPESVTTGTVGSKTYAFVGLERIGGVMVYDITDPQNASFVNYINSRDFSETLGADDSPEGLSFVSAQDSPTGKALLLAACEVGGTVAVYELENGGSSSGGHSSGGSGSSGSTVYGVTTPASVTNGTVAASVKTAAKGSTVTLTVTPDTGYTLDTLTVTDKDGNRLTLTKQSDTRYTFTMPAGQVSVAASFKTAGTTTPTGNGFTDVASSDYYAEAVQWAVEKEITTGTTSTTFSPNASCTRAQMVTFLWRAAGSPAPTSSVNPFADVTASAYYYDAVLWAVEQGITKGTSDTTFSPNQTVTRGQTVTFLYRYSGAPAVTGTNAFTDVESADYYADAVQWAVNEAITRGTSDTTFRPNSDCTRGQIVTFLYRSAQ